MMSLESFELHGDDLERVATEFASLFDPRLSSYQRAVIEWIVEQDGNATVKATAGSGKTWLCERAAEVIVRLYPDATARYLAFGKLNAEEAKKKLAIDAGTFHSLCNSAVRRYLWAKGVRLNRKSVDKHNVQLVIDELYGTAIDDVRAAVANLVSKAKGKNLRAIANNDELTALISRFDIDWDSPEFTVSDICRYTREVLAECMSLEGIRRRGQIDFDDMLWLVTQHNIRLDKVDWLLVDEAQDTNVIQREIIRRVSTPETRMIAVGDDCQAIYGFRGATADALDLIASEFGCATFPLSISYRCSRAVVAIASKYGIIEAAPNARDGSVTTLDTVKITDLTYDRYQMVLCRNTAPLISLAYRLLAAHITCKVRGRDIGAGLTSLIRKLAGKRGTLETLADKLEAYRARETERALKARDESKAQSVDDKVSSILALIDSMTQAEVDRGVTGLLESIERLFSDDVQDRTITLSTIHKAKGLEAENVAILDWHLMPSKYARRPDQKQQERNLQFVALTRARDTLTFISSDTITTD